MEFKSKFLDAGSSSNASAGSRLTVQVGAALVLGKVAPLGGQDSFWIFGLDEGGFAGLSGTAAEGQLNDSQGLTENEPCIAGRFLPTSSSPLKLGYLGTTTGAKRPIGFCGPSGILQS